MTNNIVILETNTYNLSFYLNFAKRLKKGSYLAEVEFSTKSNLEQKVCVRSQDFLIHLSELNQLSKYFTDHVKNLHNDLNYESSIFVDYSLMYQIKAMCGLVGSIDNSSYFSLLAMVNIGRTKTVSDSIYVGGESIIALPQVTKFINSIEDLNH